MTWDWLVTIAMLVSGLAQILNHKAIERLRARVDRLEGLERTAKR